MGDRYLLTVICPKCRAVEKEVYYAPTCGFVDWKCKCGYVVDLEKYSGISYEDASNADFLKELVDSLKGGDVK